MRPSIKNLKCAPEKTHWSVNSGHYVESLDLQGGNTEGVIHHEHVYAVSCASG